MLIKDVMSEKGAVCTESTPLDHVYEMMLKTDDAFATVVENHAHQKPIGIITEHDICLQIVGKGRNPKSMAAANVMNTNVTKVNCDLSVVECSELAQKTDAARIIVVDENGILCGTIKKKDFVLQEPVRPAEISFGRPAFADFQVAQADRAF